MKQTISPAGWYLILPNSVIFHPSLSLEAKGLFAYIAAKPENWAFCARRMAQELNCSEGTIKKYRKTLENTLIDASDPNSGYLLSKEREPSGFVRYFVNMPSYKFCPDKIWPDELPPDKICTINKVKTIPIKEEQIKDVGFFQNWDMPKPTALEKKRKNWWTAGLANDVPEGESDADKKIRLKSLEWMRENKEKADKLLERCKRDIRNGSESASYVNPRDIERMARNLRMQVLKDRYIANVA